MNAKEQAIFTEILAMPTATAIQRERKANALRHFENRHNDDGAYGRIEELLSLPLHSIRTNTAKQEQNDCFVWIGSGRWNAERKTNGGRVGFLYEKRARQKNRFVIYSMDVCNKGTGFERRTIPPKIYTVEQFKAILENCGAVKSTNGAHPEQAIQVTSKKLFLALQVVGVPFDPDHRYTEEDFQ